MSALASYRALARIVGPGYILVAFMGRLPLAMSQMGTLILVSAHSGRYGLGGAAAGGLAVANAIGAPIAGGLADRIGQRSVVLAQSLGGAVGMAVLVAVTHTRQSAAVVLAVACVAGLAIPQVGPLARVRWSPIVADGPYRVSLIDAAFSYEGAADEASFVLGPALVGAIAVVASSDAALLAAALMLAVFGVAFAIHPTAALTGRARHPVCDGRLLTLGFIVLVLAQWSVGMIFGSVQTGATALATAAGNPGVAGLIHAALGAGSVIAGLAVAVLPERIGYHRRALAAASALLVLSLPLLVVDSIGGLVLTVLVLGFAVAPYMISNFALAAGIVAPSRVGAAMTMMAGATGVGYATGSSIAGTLADAGGYGPALAVTVCASGIAVVLMVASQGVLTRARQARIG